MLIASPRHTADDLEHWRRLERQDAVVARLAVHRRAVATALAELRRFAEAGPCYVGVSWGKDSTVLAHLAVELARAGGPRLPIAWVRREPIDNPDCYLVRDAFAARYPDADLHEIRIDCERDQADLRNWWAVGRPGRGAADRPKQVGFAEAARRFGRRYVSGVRGAESGSRERRMAKFGPATETTCAPIGWWPTSHVFAYLHTHDLPVHPAYAQTRGGLWDRERLRVGSLGGPHGRGHGRLQWEWAYYPTEMQALGFERP